MSRIALATLVLALALSLGCRDGNNPGQQDANVNPSDGGTQDDTGTTGDGGGQYVFDNIKTLRAAPPAKFTSVTINTAVATALTGNYKTLYIQDLDGGPKSGLSIFCDFSSSSNPCPIAKSTMQTFKPGQKVKVVGTWDIFNGRDQVKPTSITVLDSAEGPLPPFAQLTVAQAIETLTQSDYEGCLVQISDATTSTPLTVTSTTPAEFKNDNYSTDCMNGPPFGAFEVGTRPNAIAVTTTFYRGIDLGTDGPCIFIYDGGVPADKLVVVGDKFTKLSGILDMDIWDMNGLILSPAAEDQYEYVPAGDHDGGL